MTVTTVSVPADLFRMILVQLRGLIDCDTQADLEAKKPEAARAWKTGMQLGATECAECEARETHSQHRHHP